MEFVMKNTDTISFWFYLGSKTQFTQLQKITMILRDFDCQTNEQIFN